MAECMMEHHAQGNKEKDARRPETLPCNLGGYIGTILKPKTDYAQTRTPPGYILRDNLDTDIQTYASVSFLNHESDQRLELNGVHRL